MLVKKAIKTNQQELHFTWNLEVEPSSAYLKLLARIFADIYKAPEENGHHEDTPGSFPLAENEPSHLGKGIGH